MFKLGLEKSLPKKETWAGLGNHETAEIEGYSGPLQKGPAALPLQRNNHRVCAVNQLVSYDALGIGFATAIAEKAEGEELLLLGTVSLRN